MFIRRVSNTQGGPIGAAIWNAITTYILPTVRYGAEACYQGLSRAETLPSKPDLYMISTRVLIKRRSEWHCRPRNGPLRLPYTERAGFPQLAFSFNRSRQELRQNMQGWTTIFLSYPAYT